MTDLFMDEHTDEMIDRVFAAIAWSRHHTYQILTKRSRRMREYVTGMMALSPEDRTRRLVSAMWVGRPLPDRVATDFNPLRTVGMFLSSTTRRAETWPSGQRIFACARCRSRGYVSRATLSRERKS